MLRIRFASVVILVPLLSVFAYGGAIFGNLRGVTRSSEGAPLSSVQVVVHSLDDGVDRSMVSNDQGAFLVENLKPGRYQLTANKAGLSSSRVTIVELAPQQSLRVDLTLASPTNSKGTGDPARTADLRGPSTAANPDNPPLTERERQLLDRIDRLEQRLAALEAKESKGPTQIVAANQPVAAPPKKDTSQTVTATRPAADSPDQGGTQIIAANQPIAAPPEKGTSQTVATTQPVPASSDQRATKTDVPTQPLLVASLGGTAELKPAEKPAVLSVMPDTQAAPAPQAPAKIAPFSDWDWTWLNGNPRTKDIYWDTKFFTPEIRADATYTYDFNHPVDHTMGGSSELFRSQEVQLEQLGVGGDFHYDNVRARLMTQFGMYSETTPRNDASPANGGWDLDTAYRYVSEAYGGYHFNWLYGVNVDAGIFMSYIGLFSYYNFDNWAYQPSFVSSNTPWFFNGVRVQIFPTAHLKIEPWFINGWQSYASANNRPGLGGQLKWTPFSWMNIISNNYGYGHDDLFIPLRERIHTDNSIEVKYYDHPISKGLDKMAFTFTGDLGCEYGGGVSCTGDHKGGPKQSFIGGMGYNRFWFRKDLFAVTIGGGRINNPGRYLVLIPPINGEGAISAATNSPYFTENPGNPFKAWDSSITFDWMPKQYITFRWEYDYRHANVPYWSGRGGITPPGGENGYPSAYACNSGAAAYNSANNSDLTLPQAQAFCAANGNGGVWFPDLRRDESFVDIDILVKF